MWRAVPRSRREAHVLRAMRAPQPVGSAGILRRPSAEHRAPARYYLTLLAPLGRVSEPHITRTRASGRFVDPSRLGVCSMCRHRVVGLAADDEAVSGCARLARVRRPPLTIPFSCSSRRETAAAERLPLGARTAATFLESATRCPNLTPPLSARMVDVTHHGLPSTRSRSLTG
jgi:hypothetical protein